MNRSAFQTNGGRPKFTYRIYFYVAEQKAYVRRILISMDELNNELPVEFAMQFRHPEHTGFVIFLIDAVKYGLPKHVATLRHDGKLRVTGTATERAAEIAERRDPNDEPATIVFVSQDGNVGIKHPDLRNDRRNRRRDD